MKKNFLRVFFISLVCFILLYIGIGYFTLNNKTNCKNEILFLLMGIDAQNLSKCESARTDTMMLVKVDFSEGKVNILSIPRDTKVNIQGRRGASKINAAHSYGGSKLAVKTVSKLLDVKLNYYVKIDYKIVEELVDTMGGIEIDVPQDMYYEDPVAEPPLYIDLKKGKQVLDGEKSLQFLRFRKGYKDADLGRIRAQQQFVKAFIEQALRPKNVLKFPKIVPSYYKNVDTNISIGVLIKGALNAWKINADSINVATIPGEGKWVGKVNYFIYNKRETDMIARKMFGDYIQANIIR